MKSKKFTRKIGTRAQVYNNNALRTSGYLYKKDLFKNKHNRIVSIKKSRSMKIKKNNPLYQGGYLRDKGDKVFGPKNIKIKRSKKSESKNSFFDLFF